ncbi:FCS-Like Zinc finger 5-like [Curcuma longa]|uniref:FCS-Like Zinc finger 5-like n=1 Tax=Curcuma longa TaxID=136217 RepID=UPI003D9F89D8
MVVRKRPRHSMPRTTSMAEFGPSHASAQLHPSDRLAQQQPNNRGAAAAAEEGQRRNTGVPLATETAPFLMACGLCRRRLGPGRDTFMYRGDIAFCSLECRQQHINQVEKRDKCSLTCTKDTPQAPSGSGDSENCGTAAAA